MRNRDLGKGKRRKQASTVSHRKRGEASVKHLRSGEKSVIPGLDCDGGRYIYLTYAPQVTDRAALVKDRFTLHRFISLLGMLAEPGRGGGLVGTRHHFNTPK